MDSLDIKIISNLLDNSKASDRQIGMRLGLSGGAVRTRINKLSKKKIIEKFVLHVNPQSLGYNIIYLVVSGQDVENIVKTTSLVGKPYLAVPCIGGITVSGVLVKDDPENKIEILKNLMKEARVLSIFYSEGPKINPNITKTDLNIIEAVIKYPRAKIEDIAKTTSLSTKTVTREIDKLLDENVIQFSILYNPKLLEGTIPYALLVSVEGNVDTILEKIQREFSDNYLQQPLTTNNQLVVFFHSDNIYKMDDVVQYTRELENVKSVDLFVPKSITFSYDWINETIREARKSPTLHLVNSN